MSKIFSKTMKKTTLFTVIIAVVLAAAVVIGSIFGFNKDVTLRDAKTLTVTVNASHYKNHKEDVVADCEKLFGDLSAEYIVEGEMTGDYRELVFVFDKDAELASVKTAISELFASKTSDTGVWAGEEISVSSASERVTVTHASYYPLRAIIASVVMAVLALAYVALRHQKFSAGLVVGVNALLGAMLSAALALLLRIPVTSGVAAVFALSSAFTAVLTTLLLGKARSAQKEESGESNETLILSAIPVKETAWLLGGMAAATLLIGILGGTAVAWTATALLVGLGVAAFLTLFFAPAFYLVVKTAADKRPAKNSYVGAKKGKKAKAEAPVEEVATEENA